MTNFAAIKLEHCADDVAWQHRRGGMQRNFDRWLRQWRRLGSDKSFTWVERVTETSRNRVVPVPDYTSANSTGSRGVYYWYTLAEGVYEINHRHKINAVRRFWIISESGSTREASKTQAMQWLSDHSESTS